MPDLAQARAVGALGFRVLPLTPNTRIPMFRDWPAKATTSPETWPAEANIGIATGNGVLVLDVDVKHGKPGMASLDALIAEYPDLAACPTVRTPSGGLHLYARVPKDARLACGVDALGLGIDIRAEGGQVVAPPSTIDGEPYQWITNPFLRLI